MDDAEGRREHQERYDGVLAVEAERAHAEDAPAKVTE
jgi:hypothetical protein